MSHYLLTMKSHMKRLKEAIKNILLLVNGKKKSRVWTYDDVQMNKDLEYLHDLLIKPIASHLSQMRPQHKLILAPTEVSWHASRWDLYFKLRVDHLNADHFWTVEECHLE